MSTPTALLATVAPADRIRVALYLTHAAEPDAGDDVGRVAVLNVFLAALGVPDELTTPMPNNPDVGRRTRRDELADWLLDLVDALEELDDGPPTDEPVRARDARRENVDGQLYRLIRVAVAAGITATR